MCVYIATVGLGTSAVTDALPLVDEYLATSLDTPERIRGVLLIPDAAVIHDARLDSLIDTLCLRLELDSSAILILDLNGFPVWSDRLNAVNDRVNSLNTKEEVMVCNLTGGSKDISCVVLEFAFQQSYVACFVLNPNSPGGPSVSFLKDPLRNRLDQSPSFYLDQFPAFDVVLEPALKRSGGEQDDSIKLHHYVLRIINSHEHRCVKFQGDFFLIFRDRQRLFALPLWPAPDGQGFGLWMPNPKLDRSEKRDQILEKRQQVELLLDYSAVTVLNRLDEKRFGQDEQNIYCELLSTCGVTHLHDSLAMTAFAFQESRNVRSDVSVEIESFEQSGTAIIAFVSEQTMPFLVTFAKHSPKIVVLLTTQRFKNEVRQIQAVIKQWSARTNHSVDVRVETAIESFGLNPTAEILERYAGMLSAHNAILNLNGGTKSMAMSAFRWGRNRPDIHLEYVNGAHVSVLRDDQLPTTPSEPTFSIAETFLANGYRAVIEQNLVQYDEELFRYAKNAKRFWKEFCARWKELGGKPPIEGIANEYMTYYDVAHTLEQREHEMAHSVKLYSFADETQSDLKYEADVAVLCQFSLALFEAKPTVFEALSSKNRESVVQLFLAGSAGGRFAHAVVVGYEVGKDFMADQQVKERYEVALPHRNKTPEIILAKRKHYPNDPNKIEMFPRCLGQMFKTWGWL
jgi:hypothetical protein